MALMDLLPGRKEVVVEEPAPPPVKSHKGLLIVPTSWRNNTTTMWDTADPESLKVAKQAFDTAVLTGMAAFATKPTESPLPRDPWAQQQGEQIREFDPEADEIRMVSPYAGG